MAAASALALSATQADAQIVYTDIEPDITITDSFPEGEGIPIDGPVFDFDGDGDSEILIGEASGVLNVVAVLPIDGDGADQATGFAGNLAQGYGYFLALSSGAEIGPAAGNILDGDVTPSLTFLGGDPNGFRGAGDVFLGVRFSLDTGTHYGWIRVEVPAAGGSVTVKDIAYESTPEAAISAGASGVAVEPGALPDGYEFSAIGPNPIRARAHFSIRVAEPEHVRVTVVDLLGREVASIFDGELASGVPRQMEIQAGALPAGTYVVRVTGDTFDTTRRITVAR